MKLRNLLTSALLLTAAAASAISPNPKREFRGAWMHTVHQGQYARQSTSENQAYLRNQLDSLKAAGVNAIIFQVRPSADAFYKSNLEPWSRFLTGEAGKVPAPYWDPLQFMIDECHQRGMELHAWLNPYRVTTTPTEKPAPNHIYYKHPERFVKYDKKLYFDPAQPENREFIENVVLDIITNYDVDGIHMDDYFYPYPVAGVPFPDDASYKKYGKGMDRGDWRRQNVDLLIEGIHNVIAQNRPWVRFGVSPFGIWRNEKTDPRGSKTQGLQNYDDLYADVLLWAEKGWIDYNMPQLYWELEQPRASSLELVKWWNDNAFGRHMYIGQDVNKTMSKPDLAPSTNPSQLRHKIALTRTLPNIQGNCWWPGYSITRNYKGVADSLANDFQSTVALTPTYPWIHKTAPAQVKGVKLADGKLTWKAPQKKGSVADVNRYVIYRSADATGNAINDPANILAVVYDNSFTVPANIEDGSYLIVTALDRVNNESSASMPVKVK